LKDISNTDIVLVEIETERFSRKEQEAEVPRTFSQ
jgi:hypothetical protein